LSTKTFNSPLNSLLIYSDIALIIETANVDLKEKYNTYNEEAT